jgi:hypothetical protein
VKPPQVPGAVNIAAIACGGFHNLALAADGRVISWGTNDYGQVGVGCGWRRAAPAWRSTAVWRSVPATALRTTPDCCLCRVAAPPHRLQLGNGSTIYSTTPVEVRCRHCSVHSTLELALLVLTEQAPTLIDAC